VRLQIKRITLLPQRRPSQNQTLSAATHATTLVNSKSGIVRCPPPRPATAPAVIKRSMDGSGRHSCWPNTASPIARYVRCNGLFIDCSFRTYGAGVLRRTVFSPWIPLTGGCNRQNGCQGNTRAGVHIQSTITAEPFSVSSLTASNALFASSSAKVVTRGRIFKS